MPGHLIRLWTGMLRSRWLAVLLVAAALAAYVLTLAPGPLGGDAGEFQAGARVWGLSHPTGYPLYMLLIKAWALLPIGSVAYRVNLLGAALAAATIGLLYTTLRMVTERTLASAVAALVLAFSPLFWSQALIADKYALNVFLVTVVLWAAVRWAQEPGRRRLCLLALAYGLSLTHHRTMLLFSPAVVGFVLWVEPGTWRSRRNWPSLLYFLLPLGLYLYLPLTRALGQPLSNWWPSTVGEWLSYLLARGHLGESQTSVGPLSERLAFYGAMLVQQFTICGLLLAAIGGLRLAFRRRSLLFLTLVSLVLQAFSSSAYYKDPRNQAFFLPSFLIVALWLGVGGAAILDWLAQRLARWPEARPWLITAIGLLLCVLPTFLLLRTYPQMYRRHRQDRPLDVWRQDLMSGEQAARLALGGLPHVAPGGIIVCDWEQATPLQYYQLVEGLRPDVQVIHPIERLEEEAASGRSLYLGRNHPGLVDRWHPVCSGPLIALQREPAFEAPTGISLLSTRLGDAFELLGFAYGEADFSPATVVPLTLYWQAVVVPAHDYSVSLRLFDEAGQQVFKVDSQHPVLGTYPTSRWAAGEVVSDYYEIQLSPDLPPGVYHWGVILYRTLPEGGWENLRIAGTDGEIAMGGAFDVRKQR